MEISSTDIQQKSSKMDKAGEFPRQTYITKILRNGQNREISTTNSQQKTYKQTIHIRTEMFKMWIAR